MRLIERGNLGVFKYGLDPNTSLASSVLRMTALLCFSSPGYEV